MMFNLFSIIIYFLSGVAAEIQVNHFDPEKIEIRLKDLPKPYASTSAFKFPKIVPIPENESLSVAHGFDISVFAEFKETPKWMPRWLQRTPTGELIVSEFKKSHISILLDSKKDGIIDTKKVFLEPPEHLGGKDDFAFGMEFAQDHNGAWFFYVAFSYAVWSFPYEMGELQVDSSKGKKIFDLTQGSGRHWTRNLLLSPDKSFLYVSTGSNGNAGEKPEPWPRSTVIKIGLDGSWNETVITGARNPIGLDIHPVTNDLFVSCQERDEIGDDLVPDFLIHAKMGQFYGYPYAYLSSALPDPRLLNKTTGESLEPELVAKTITPPVLFQAHSAVMALRFSPTDHPISRYRNGAFVAFRGSWNRHQGTGYKVVFVPFNEKNEPSGYYEDVVSGFLVDPSGPSTWGRPVGMMLLQEESSLLFTDEANQRIYKLMPEGFPPTKLGTMIAGNMLIMLLSLCLLMDF